MMLNNPLYFKNRNYTIPFGLDNGKQEKKKLNKIRYTLCYNPSLAIVKWTVLLHSWGRNSLRMVTRAEIYWENGYSLVFIDARSHGQSKYVRVSKAIDFAEDTVAILQEEKISMPVIHGLSFGSIAALFVANNYETKALIGEAMATRFDVMFKDLLNYLHFPRIIFGWIPWLIMNWPWNFPWEIMHPEEVLKTITVPIFLIHGQDDSMFDFRDHYEPNKVSLKETDSFWLVEGSKHDKMALNPLYHKKMEKFIKQIDFQES
ncbi:MAG: alpha/beta hydrolase [Candidatus Heimdallarchaeota archaeon]|nr:alpha/beta hydrolase [Candidatus Heimdallarchaeota archaeon]